MFTVALVGADGAGKTSIARRLVSTQPVRIKYVYMGVNPEASTHMLPTTRLLMWTKRILGKPANKSGPPDPNRESKPQKHSIKRLLRGTKSCLLLLNRICEEWYRQCVVWYYRLRGFVVLFDRHFYLDYYAHDIAATTAKRSLGRKLHGLMLQRLYPKPDLVIVLDAPAEVLFGRKGEGSVLLIEQRRHEYLQLEECVAHFRVVNVDRPRELVFEEVTRIITDFAAKAERRRGGGGAHLAEAARVRESEGSDIEANQ